MVQQYDGEHSAILATARLVLRPVAPADAADVAEFAGDWDVARMMADIPHPFGIDAAARWTELVAGDLNLAITLDGRMVGGVSVCALDVQGADCLADRTAELGFWLGQPWWGQGYAREAATGVIGHLAEARQFARLTSGHFVDNPVSGRVLADLGFTATGVVVQQRCLARGQTLEAVRYQRPLVTGAVAAGSLARHAWGVADRVLSDMRG